MGKGQQNREKFVYTKMEVFFFVRLTKGSENL